MSKKPTYETLDKRITQLEEEVARRQETEAALRESEARYRAIITEFEGFIYICSEDYRIEFMNQKLIERTGRDATGEYCYKVLHDLDSICPRCVNKRVFRGETVRWDVLSPKDNRWYYIVNTPIRHGDGTISKQALILDITERKEAEGLIQEAHTIISRSPVVALLWRNDEGWPVEYVTENVVNLFGYTAQEFMSEDLVYSQVIHPDDLERVMAEVKQYSSMEDCEDFTHEPYRIIDKDGIAHWVNDRTFIRRSETGEITHYQGVLEDITERVEVQAALKKSENFLEDVFNSIQDGISVLDKDLNILLVNRNMEEWYKHHAPLKGKKCYQCYQGREEPCNPCPSIQAIQSGNMEVDIVSGPEDSPIEWIELFSFPIHDRNSGEITGVVEFVRDVSEKKMLEHQLLHAQKMEAIGTLAGGIAHDFNNLLMAIQGYTSLMLLDSNETHPYHEPLRGIENIVKRASYLTTQLLGFARGGNYEVIPVNLNRIVEDTTEMFARTKKEISIATRLDNELWTVEVDRRQIENVLLNLYINAWQAMPEGGELNISTHNVCLNESQAVLSEVEPGRFVRVEVADTGVGMDNHTRLRVFDPFFTTKEMRKGTGLGLASAYGIVKSQGGMINVHSELGKGSTFNIYLPASDKEIVAPHADPLELRNGNETVLLVDDESEIIDVGRSMLEYLGYSVAVACGGRDAVEIYRKEHVRIDLILLDVIMPDMNGSETFDHLKEINPDVRVLLSSGYSENGRVKEILCKGCAGFIQKPFSLIELSGKLQEILDG